MGVASTMLLLLYCGVVASAAAAGNNAVALPAADDAALEDDAAYLPAKSEAVLKPKGQGDITNRNLLKAMKVAFKKSSKTQTCSDNSGRLQLQFSQISEQVTQMGAEIRVLKAQTTADVQTLQNTTKQLEQETENAGGEIRALQGKTTADVQSLKNTIMQLEQAIKTARASSSTFVRWGSSTCGSSSLVYSGVVGGGWWKHTGSAVNFLCLTLSPRTTSQALTRRTTYLYGGEYETEGSTQNKNPVCAVCAASFSATVMIPGTDACTPGWRLQYSGFLMAGKYDHAAATEFICVDRALESYRRGGRGSSNDEGALLYFTRARCGSLPCTPYKNDAIVTCAVCSK